MNERGRITIRIIAGGYLAYLGIDLIRNVITGKPDNAILFGVIGVLFLGVGAGFLVKSLRDYRNCQRAEDEDIEESEADETMEADGAVEADDTIEEEKTEGGE